MCQCVFDKLLVVQKWEMGVVGEGGGVFMGHPVLTRYGSFISQGFTFIFNTYYLRVSSNLKLESDNTF